MEFLVPDVQGGVGPMLAAFHAAAGDSHDKQGVRGIEAGSKSISGAEAFKFDRGTTTLAFRYAGGAMVAVDSRASQGSLVASQTVRKVIEINEYLLGTMAGGAADCSFWERVLAQECRMIELRQGQRPTVGHAAKILANIFWEYRGYGLSCGTMITGFDVCDQQARLFYVADNGSRVAGDMFSVGSGSTYAYGVLDTYHKWDMSDEEAQELAQRAIWHAGHRDGGSGGVVRVYWIPNKDVEREGPDGVSHTNPAGKWIKLVEANDFFDLGKHYAPECLLVIDPTKA